MTTDKLTSFIIYNIHCYDTDFFSAIFNRLPNVSGDGEKTPAPLVVNVR